MRLLEGQFTPPAHTSTADWANTVNNKAGEICRLTLYTRSDSVSDGNEITVPVSKIDRISNIEAQLKKPEKLVENLRQMREKPNAPAPGEKRFQFSIALFVLCQGYLAAHGWDGLKGWDRLSEDFKNAVQSKNGDVSKPVWWRQVFDQAGEEMFMKEVRDLEESRSLTGRAEHIIEFVEQLRVGGSPQIQKDDVRAVYQALQDLLREV